MAYRPRRGRYSRGRTSARRSYRSYSGRRSYGRRRRAAPRRGNARIVIQVVGGGGTVPASPVALGQKASRPVRARY